MIKWREPEYSRFGRDFGLSGLHWSRERPADWPSSRARLVEEALETILILHLGALTGMPLYYVCREPQIEEDLVAVDSLGRVHLFELKKTTIREDTTLQLGQYLLSHLFESATDYIAEIWRRRADSLDLGLARHLAGAIVNRRTMNEGSKFVGSELSENELKISGIDLGWPLAKPEWNSKLAEGEKHELVARAMLAWTEREGRMPEPAVTYEEVRELAFKWTKKLGTQEAPPRPRFRPRRPVVLWLVAPGVSDGAQKAVKQLRRSGLDARVLLVDVRRVDGVAEWVVEVTREDALGRDRLENKLFALAEEERYAERDHIPTLHLELYDVVAASSQRHQGGGKPRTHPRALVTSYHKVQEEITIV